jgi:hypothetical protein
MMSGVLVILALLIAPYVRPWLAQRSQLAQGREEVARLQREVDGLTAERNRWDDPAYVKAQARARLHLVMPGEIGYVNLDPATGRSRDADPRSAEAALPPRHDDAWYGALWQSVVGAGIVPTLTPSPAPVSVPPGSASVPSATSPAASVPSASVSPTPPARPTAHPTP